MRNLTTADVAFLLCTSQQAGPGSQLQLSVETTYGLVVDLCADGSITARLSDQYQKPHLYADADEDDEYYFDEDPITPIQTSLSPVVFPRPRALFPPAIIHSQNLAVPVGPGGTSIDEILCTPISPTPSANLLRAALLGQPNSACTTKPLHVPFHQYRHQPQPQPQHRQNPPQLQLQIPMQKQTLPPIAVAAKPESNNNLPRHKYRIQPDWHEPAPSYVWEETTSPVSTSTPTTTTVSSSQREQSQGHGQGQGEDLFLDLTDLLSEAEASEHPVPEQDLETRYGPEWYDAYLDWAERLEEALHKSGNRDWGYRFRNPFSDEGVRTLWMVEGLLLAVWLSLQDDVGRVAYVPGEEEFVLQGGELAGVLKKLVAR